MLKEWDVLTEKKTDVIAQSEIMQKSDNNQVKRIINDAYTAIERWYQFFLDIELSSKDYVIILNNNDDEINFYTLHFLGILKQERGITSFIIISDKEDMERLVRQYATAEFRYYTIETEMLNDLTKFPSTYAFFEQVLVNSFENLEDVDGFSLLGVNGLEKKDIVATAILGLTYTPTEEEIEQSRQFNFISLNRKKINWSEKEKWVPRYRYLFKNHLDFIKYQIDTLTKNQLIEKNNDIYLFGATQTSQVCVDILKDYNLAGILDNNTKQKQVYENNNLYLPEEKLLPFNSNNRILIAAYHYKSMCEQLNTLGYELGKQVFIVNYRCNAWERPLEELKKEISDKLKWGNEIYTRLRNLYPKEELLLCPYPGTGDIYLVNLYLQGYLNKQNINSYAMFVLDMGLYKVAELFKISADILSKEDMDALIYWIKIAGKKRNKVRIIDHHMYQKKMRRLEGIRDIHYNIILQHAIFHASERRTVPNIKWESADELFDKYQLIPEKVIVFSPYANSIRNIPEEFWEKLVLQFEKQRFTVCTNVGSNSEKPIAGTLPIFIPYIKSYDFMNRIAAFIGIRSGLADIISSTTGKMVLLYTGRVYAAQSTMDYFGLRNMGLKKDNIFEENYDKRMLEDKNYSKLIDDICRFVLREI